MVLDVTPKQEDTPLLKNIKQSAPYSNTYQIDILPQYPVGYDLTLMECFYQKKARDCDGNWVKDKLILVYKDNIAKKSKVEIIEEPEYTFFKVNDNIVIDHNLLFIEKEKVHPITVKFNRLEKEIAKETGTIDIFDTNIRNRNFQENRKIHVLKSIFSSDIAIEDYYRLLFSRKFKNDVCPISKAYFDIEVDGLHAKGDFPELGECPINAISFLDEKHEEIHSFLLRNYDNPLIEELENKIENGEFGYKEINEFVTEAIGGKKMLRRYGMENMKYQVHFFDDEIEMLQCFFALVHKYAPDFIMGYNSSGFDLQYIIHRIYALGKEPADIMADQSWPIRIVRHYVDEKNLSMFAERGDYTFISGTTVWLDQLIQFASRRKSKYGSFSSFKLDDIGQLIAKVHKLDYSYITHQIEKLPYLNFIIFMLYNIFDVVVQKCIEHKTEDLEYIFAKCIMNNTSYRRGHRQTVYLINRMTSEFEKMGYIIGNNVNKWNEKPKDKFLGALVHDPIRTDNYAKIVIDGIPIFVVDNLQDFDSTLMVA